MARNSLGYMGTLQDRIIDLKTELTNKNAELERLQVAFSGVVFCNQTMQEEINRLKEEIKELKNEKK